MDLRKEKEFKQSILESIVNKDSEKFNKVFAEMYNHIIESTILEHSNKIKESLND